MVTGDEDRPPAETVARIAALAEAALARQLEAAEATDNKAWQAFGAGSIVLGLGVAGDLDGAYAKVALVAYLVVAISALVCLVPRTWRLPPTIPELWDNYGMRDVRDVDHVVVDTLYKGFHTNQTKLFHKALWLGLAVVCLAVETVTLALFVLSD